MKYSLSLLTRLSSGTALCGIVLNLLTQAFAGSLLVTDASNAVIRRYDSSTGAYLGVFVPSGNGLAHPHGLAYGPDGNLYVCEYSSTQLILRYDGQTGAFLGVFATASGYPYDLIFGPDANLYVGLSGGAVQRLNGATGASMGLFTPAHPGDFGGMAFHNGWFLVTYGNSPNGELDQYNGTSGAFIANLYSGFSGNGPRAPRVGPDGNIYVPDWQTTRVVKFNGGTLAHMGNLIDDPLHFYPIALAFGSDGALYVLEDNGTASSINRYNLATGAFISQLVAPGSGGLGRGQYMIFMPEPLPPPRLLVTGAQSSAGLQELQLTWTNNGAGCVLEGSGALTGGWTTVTTPWVTNGNWVSTTVTSPSPAQFYRLRSN